MSIEIRRATHGDVARGLVDVLSELSPTGAIPVTRVEEVLRGILDNDDYCIWVAVKDGKVVGTIRVVFERKLTRTCGIVAHIEDVVVTNTLQGTGVGAQLVRTAVAEAQKRQSYKVILDCSEDNVPFYEKSGFRRHEVGMRMNLDSVRQDE